MQVMFPILLQNQKNMENQAKNYLNEKICPICNKHVTESEYLNNTFNNDPHANYLSHLVTHYRHNHITSWNKCWGYNGNRYRQGWFGDYEQEKIKVNERAKRQLIRKGRDVFRSIGITSDTFLKLQNTDEATMTLALKILS